MSLTVYESHAFIMLFEICALRRACWDAQVHASAPGITTRRACQRTRWRRFIAKQVCHTVWLHHLLRHILHMNIATHTPSLHTCSTTLTYLSVYVRYILTLIMITAGPKHMRIVKSQAICATSETRESRCSTLPLSVDSNGPYVYMRLLKLTINKSFEIDFKNT